MHKAIGGVAAATILLMFAGRAAAAELKSSTLDAWHRFVDSAQQRMQARLQEGAHFLWSDDDPDRADRLRQGEIEVSPLVHHGWQNASGGLIHDWIGAAFIPDANIEDLLSVIENYDRYKDIFKPVVIDSKLQRQTDGSDLFSMRWLHRALFVTAAMDTQNESRTYRVDPCRAYTISRTTNVREIENFGQSDQRELPPDTGNGFIWRLSSISRYEQRDGGLYVEVEAMALTRDIPLSLRFMIKPVVMELSRNSLKTTLDQTRSAVHDTQIARAAGNAPQGDFALLMRARPKGR